MEAAAERMVVMFLVIALCCACFGATFCPAGYTYTGVSSENGSDPNAGCPLQCRMTGAINIRFCDCTGIMSNSTATFTDGIIPTFDNSQRGTWASQLYTVDVTTPSYAIGFSFSSEFMLQEVELSIFFCTPWLIPRSGLAVTIHRGIVFPGFVSASPIGNITLTLQPNCRSLETIYITTSPTGEDRIYFIEFTSPVTVGGIYIGEVIFRNEVTQNQASSISTTTTMSTTTMSTSTTDATSIATSTISSDVSLSTLEMTDIITTSNSTDMPTSSSLSNQNTNSTLEGTDAFSQTTPGSSTSLGTSTTEELSGTESSSSSSIIPIVSALGAVIVILLILVIAGGVIVVFCMSRRKKSDRVEAQQLQDVVLENTMSHQTIKFTSPETKTSDNNHHERTVVHGPRIASPNSALPTTSQHNLSSNPNSYSKIVHPLSRDTTPLTSPNRANSKDFGYNDIAIKETELNTTYDSIDAEETSSQVKCPDMYNKIDLSGKDQASSETPTHPPGKKRLIYSLIRKDVPPEVPKKTPELYRVLKSDNGEPTETGCNVMNGNAEREETVNPKYDSTTVEDPAYYSTIDEARKAMSVNPTYEGKYNEVEGDISTDEVYSEITEKLEAGGGEKSATHRSTMKKSAPDRKTEDSKVNTTQGDPYLGIYDNPNVADSDKDEANDDANNVYDCVREELHPAMFIGAEGTNDFQDEDIYAPVYDTSTLGTSSLRTIPVLKPENIKKVKTIGTGYFGKVVLADTVDLSQKDLNIGEDENTTKPIRVAIKQLKANPSAQALEGFEKELKFMSRLDHENVIKVLGSCKGSVTYIMMEYMEKGDLARYLVNFENTVINYEEQNDISISMGTLTDMCSQTASGMKYLSSKNFIHRDLATRNCLVGNNMQVKIADFGMSRNLYQSHYYILSGVNAALPIRWMAKECFCGKFSTKSDVWAFGVTMWEIFTLAKDIPYEDMQDEQLVVDATLKHPRTLLAKPTNCPANMYDVMLMCWKESPSDRASFETLYDILNDSL